MRIGWQKFWPMEQNCTNTDDIFLWKQSYYSLCFQLKKILKFISLTSKCKRWFVQFRDNIMTWKSGNQRSLKAKRRLHFRYSCQTEESLKRHFNWGFQWKSTKLCSISIEAKRRKAIFYIWDVACMKKMNEEHLNNNLIHTRTFFLPLSQLNIHKTLYLEIEVV